MALLNYTITYGEWKKICLAGENGKVWMKKIGSDGTSKVVIAHTDSVQTHGSPVGDNIPVDDAIDLDIEKGYVLPQSGNPHDSEKLTADNTNDIYYATLRDVDETCIITTDFS